MGAAENQLHENETKESMIKLYLESLDKRWGLESAVKAADALVEALAECSQLIHAFDRCEPCRMQKHLYTELRKSQKKAKEKAEGHG